MAVLFSKNHPRPVSGCRADGRSPKSTSETTSVEAFLLAHRSLLAMTALFLTDHSRQESGSPAGSACPEQTIAAYLLSCLRFARAAFLLATHSRPESVYLGGGKCPERILMQETSRLESCSLFAMAARLLANHSRFEQGRPAEGRAPKWTFLKAAIGILNPANHSPSLMNVLFGPNHSPFLMAARFLTNNWCCSGSGCPLVVSEPDGFSKRGPKSEFHELDELTEVSDVSSGHPQFERQMVLLRSRGSRTMLLPLRLPEKPDMLVELLPEEEDMDSSAIHRQ